MLHFFKEELVISLTFRESQVLNFVAAGDTAKEVADKLSIASCTVERHIENVRLKTRTRNRVHMIAYAMNNNLITVAV